MTNKIYYNVNTAFVYSVCFEAFEDSYVRPKYQQP